jgi:hypothetical protein
MAAQLLLLLQMLQICYSLEDSPSFSITQQSLVARQTNIRNFKIHAHRANYHSTTDTTAVAQGHFKAAGLSRSSARVFLLLQRLQICYSLEDSPSFSITQQSLVARQEHIRVDSPTSKRDFYFCERALADVRTPLTTF